ncbi:hypothetical protein [Sorangium sp. So ce394]|uniref:hypothetical protein n=1 Tax=Sorangium sp. So ce394 TaxID=3133310 RepID=UPI003F5B4A1D
MIHRMLTKVAVLFSSCVAFTVLGAAGCYAPAVDDTELAEGEAEAGDPSEDVGLSEDVGVAQEALTACDPVLPHGNSAFENQFTTTIGCACHPWYTKSSYNVWHAGHGDCWPLGWASTDPNDCRVKVQVKNSGGYFNGECRAHIEDKLDPAASCVNRCGGQAPAGCYCDSLCSRIGDCCPDKAPTCG